MHGACPGEVGGGIDGGYHLEVVPGDVCTEISGDVVLLGLGDEQVIDPTECLQILRVGGVVAYDIDLTEIYAVKGDVVYFLGQHDRLAGGAHGDTGE